MASFGLLRNIAYNVAGSALPMAVSLVTVPIYISTIGTARYGIVAIAWLLLGYFGFLDFGLSRATTNALSRLANDKLGRRGEVLVTSVSLNVCFGIIAGLAFYWVLFPLARHLYSLPARLGPEISASLPLIASMLPIGMVGGVAQGALQSRERFLLLNVVQTTGYVAGQTVPVVAAIWIGPELPIVLAAALSVRVATILALYVAVIYLEYPFDPFGFRVREVRALFGYGAWVSVTSILTPVLETFDQFLIGVLLGPSAVAHYVVPMNLASRSQIVATALASALFPRLSRESGQIAGELTQRAGVALAYAFSALCGPAIILAEPFLRLWLGADFAAQAGPVARVLLVGAWLNGLAFLPYGLLQAQGRPDITAKIHLAEVIPFIAIVYGLTTLLGLPGAALAWTSRNLADSIAMFYFAGSRFAQFFAILPAISLMAACFVLGVVMLGTGWLLLIPLAAVMGLACLIVGMVIEPSLSSLSKRVLPTRVVTRIVTFARGPT